MRTKKIDITQEGYDKLMTELKELREVKRPAILIQLQKAREMGDLSENGAYTSAKEALRFLDRRLVWIELQLRNVQIVERDTDLGVISLGDTVILEKDGKRTTYQIVGDLEADIANGKLSTNSPIGKAVFGKKLNDVVVVQIPAGDATYKIVAIS